MSSDINKRFDTNEIKFGELNKRFDTNDAKFDELNNSLSSIESKINEICREIKRETDELRESVCVLSLIHI